MKTFQAETLIAADPTHVWATLLETDRWSSWDPALQRVEGSLGDGGKLTIHVAEVSRPFRLSVIDWQPERRSIPDLQPSFDAFVAGLRTAVEASADA